MPHQCPGQAKVAITLLMQNNTRTMATGKAKVAILLGTHTDLIRLFMGSLGTAHLVLVLNAGAGIPFCASPTTTPWLCDETPMAVKSYEPRAPDLSVLGVKQAIQLDQPPRVVSMHRLSRPAHVWVYICRIGQFRI
eukprot:1161404-Pelagomonas_calceolata.AAC.4